LIGDRQAALAAGPPGDPIQRGVQSFRGKDFTDLDLTLGRGWAGRGAILFAEGGRGFDQRLLIWGLPQVLIY